MARKQLFRPPGCPSAAPKTLGAASGHTSLFIPKFTSAQSLQSHWAMYLAGVSPADVNQPPAYRLLPETASAFTQSFIPKPNADQLLPSHLAMYLTALPPAIVKV